MLQILLVIIFFANHAFCEVVNDKHFTKCNEFFYKSTPPSEFNKFITNEICQRYLNGYYYATLYDTFNRIPIYSAYRLDDDSCSGDQPDRRNTWFVEPQLSGMGFPVNMDTAGPLTDTYKLVQAINTDFRNTNFDRGHLNPNFYQCGAARTATFTLTNAVPQDPCFNQNIWKEMETTSKNIMIELCSFPGAKRFFVTGAVPGNKRIPSRSQDEEGDATREYNRVIVPTDMWTAACCDSSASTLPGDRNKGFSFGYYGKNEPDAWVTPAEVSTMEGILTPMYQLQVLDIFADSCFEGTVTSKNAIKKLRVPLNKRVTENVLDLSKSSESSVPPAKRLFIQSVDDVLDQNPSIVQRNWKFADGDIGLQSQRLQIQLIRQQLLPVGLTTVLTMPKSELKSKDKVFAKPIRGKANKLISSINTTQTGRKRRTDFVSKEELYFIKSRQNKKDNISTMAFSRSYNSDPKDVRKVSLKKSQITDSYEEANVKAEDLEETIIDNYLVVPAFPSTWTGNGDRCRDGHSCGYHSEDYYWCYTDWSDNWGYCCLSECTFSNNTYQSCLAGSEWSYCSYPYSTITVSGKHCRLDHSCGIHSKKYFWCYTDTNQNWEYCCQPWHNCLKHNEDYTWCYAGYKKNETWKYCNY